MEGRPGCDPPVTLQVCPAGQHRHAAAAGGHTGCQPAHSAPSCTWSAALTWSPGHGGSATGGHVTTTGMSRCVSVRAFCADVAANVVAETADAQRPGGGNDNYALAAGYNSRRVPAGRNLSHAQFTPTIVVNNSRAPGSIRLAPGEWASVSGSVTAGSGSVGAVAYDYDNSRWRNCGRVSWTRNLTIGFTGGQHETSPRRFRFPAGGCAGAVAATVNAAWTVTYDSSAGPGYDTTQTGNTSTRWIIDCGPTTRVAGVCDSLTDGRKARLAFDSNAGLFTPTVRIGASNSNDSGIWPDLAPPVELLDRWPADRRWAYHRTPEPWRADGAAGSGALMYAYVLGRQGAYSRVVDATATHPSDGSSHNCGQVAFRLASLAWTAGPGGDLAARRPLTAESPISARRYLRGSLKRYEMNADDAAATALPIRCTAVWPAGGWDPWTQTSIYNNHMTDTQRQTLRASLSNCAGAARFFTPENDTEGACPAERIDITLTAVWEAGTLKDGQPAHAYRWTPGTRYGKLAAWTGTLSAVAAVWDYEPGRCLRGGS